MTSGTSIRGESLSERPVFESFLPDQEPIRLRIADTTHTAVFCKVFFRTFQAAFPPFIDRQREQFDYRIDSSFMLQVSSGITEYVQLARQGFYFFQTDTNDLEGFTLFRAYQGYPKVNTPLRMIEPLRYLTSSEEFEKLRSSAFPKTAVDSFWVQITGGADRAVEMIRSYYSRVEDANSFFFSFCEGWKTDRGMIYIIFGPPSAVYRSDTEEIWTYGEPNHRLSMQFVFMKVMNPFTDNDYILQRQTNYKTYWYNAVRQWRR